MNFEPYYSFRTELREALERDLVGPAAGKSEVIADDPINVYISGVLYPQAAKDDRNFIAPENDVDIVDDGDEETAPDPPVALANVRYPSSMGLTFAVDTTATEQLHVKIGAARYRLLPDEEALSASEVKRQVWARGTQSSRRWQREPLNPPLLTVNVADPVSRYIPTGIDGLNLFVRVRPADEAGDASITFVLVNSLEFDFSTSETGLRDAYSFFQSKISVTPPDGSSAIFVERPVIADLAHDEDLRSYRLLYRHAKEFAVGHGCSVQWERSQGASDRAVRVWTSFAPFYALRIAESNPAISSEALGMEFLAEGTRTEILSRLNEFASDYNDWIADLEAEIPALDATLQGTAGEHIERCREAYDRIAKGIALLETDPAVFRAFRLANLAMVRQLARKIWLENGKVSAAPEISDTMRWRPFQLAFILLALESIARPGAADRKLADLLWFPTGGGKTEAYLGLIAFTVFLRRIQDPHKGAGVTALMRYTLRLLTLQQFQRASLLICHLEDIRREADDLGNEPISIGMWVGQRATPNTLDQARESLDKLRSAGTVEEKNPIQLQNCPWCGAPLNHRNYWISADANPRLVIACRQKECAFHDGLPVYVVDEDIYRYRPTLVISTVDKFAALPWRTETGELFNLPISKIEAQRPPELIIQDELHLISGPLGTLTGLYETAVDLLCTYDGIPPKVIASTATIRRAQQQSVGLFNRDVRQFPPPGLDARDSYFAVEASPEDKATRLYLGLMAPGTSHTTLMVRTYASLLQNVGAADVPPEVLDPYWTLVGYFNSLRVLGGARMQVHDDVSDRINLLATLSGENPRAPESLIELTSRAPSGEISGYLKRLQEEFASGFAVDVVLATNMISVGVDIDRLGLMVVMGQPQSPSEYIQATSRVGRKYPGLVVVLFNAAKSRDRSHYESFVPFHAAIYRQVESSGVTPFSSRSRDRGLHSVLIALARLTLPAFSADTAAEAVLDQEGKLHDIARLIVERVRDVAPEEADATAQQLDEIIATWRERAATRPDLRYSNWKDAETALLFDASVDELDRRGAFPTLWSLRDVDRESNIYLMRLKQNE